MIYDVIIIGAGTAGLTAAIYAKRAGKSALVFEYGNYGGQIINTPEVENYPAIEKISGFEFATNLANQAINLGAQLEYKKVNKIVNNNDYKTVVTQNESYKCKAVIIATGAKNRPLGVEKETELIGKGVSYCATCDGMFFRNKDVAVVGGGNTALEDAGFLASYCNKVYIIHRRNEFRGENKLVENLKKKENVEFVLDSKVVELKENTKLNSIIVENLIDNSKKEIEVSGLFVAIGQMPENSAFSDIINLDSMGYIVADESCKTNVAGIFVAGDCRTKTVRQLTTAASDGAISALASVEYINN